MKPKPILVATAIGVAMLGLSSVPAISKLTSRSQNNPTQPFKKVAIFLEYNSTDEDMGVHIDTDHNEGISDVKVVAPNNRVIVEQEWVTQPRLGLTELFSESAEPDLTSAINSYPAGNYKFYGKTAIGRKKLFSTGRLSHDLLAPPDIQFPEEGATGVPSTGFDVVWAPVPQAQLYLIEFADANGTRLESKLSPSETSFTINAQVLSPNTTYTVGVSSKHANGNQSLASVEFTTGP